jgi:hypothetical protein
MINYFSIIFIKNLISYIPILYMWLYLIEVEKKTETRSKP